MDCRICGKPAGFFRLTHSECARQDQERKAALAAARWAAQEAKARTHAELRADAPAAIFREGGLLELEHRLLDATEAGHLTPQEKSQLLSQVWRSATQKALEDDLLSAEEESRLVAAKERFMLADADLEVDGSLTRLQRAAVLRRVMAGEPTTNVELGPGFPVVLQRGELPVWAFHGVDYLEDRQRRQFVGGSQGVSVRVMKGVYYRVGAFKGEAVYSTQRVKVDRGMLLLTDKNVYFAGPAKSIRIPYRKIVTFEPFRDGIGLMRDAQTAKPQIFSTGDGWFTYNLAANLARNAN